MISSNFSDVVSNQSASDSVVFYTPDRIARIASYSIVFLVGLIGNILVIFVVKNKQHRTTNDCFIMNLAISDLLMILETSLVVLLGVRHASL